ncbi:MAG: hypothetical protein II830_04260 [Alphaproteobacteria bacterium]|nr:hypothetical protein [Alphaproteobacteria bacterium]
MSELGKKFTQDGGAKPIAFGVGANSGVDKEAFAKALFNGGPEDRVVVPMKDAAEAEKVPSKLFMNLIEKGLDVMADKELAAGSNADIKLDNIKVKNMDVPTFITDGYSR